MPPLTDTTSTPCEVCGADSHGHQSSGSDDVQWLCRAHHGGWHSSFGASIHPTAPNGGICCTVVGSIVSPRIRVNSDPNTLLNQPPEFGIIDVFTSSAQGCSVTVKVLWANLNYFDSGTLAQLSDVLDVITKASDATLQRLVGRWVRRVTGLNTALDVSGGTSREFDGKVVSVYNRAPLGVCEGPTEYCLVQNDDGTYIEDVATRFVVDPTR